MKQIDVNGQTCKCAGVSLSYEALVKLAKLEGMPTVVWSHEYGGGTVTPGNFVVVSEGMRFTIIHTDKA